MTPKHGDSGVAAKDKKTMGFFEQNGGYATSGGDYSVADDGIYTCRLKEVEPTRQPSFDDKNIMEDTYKWVFEATSDADDQGNPYRFVKFTKRNYGNEKAAITILVDGMLGRHLTKEEFAELDLDILMAKKFRVNVELTTNTTGKEINKILWVKPEKASNAQKMGQFPSSGQKATEVKAAANHDSNDPFADD